jgi:hypothetical protein
MQGSTVQAQEASLATASDAAQAEMLGTQVAGESIGLTFACALHHVVV